MPAGPEKSSAIDFLAKTSVSTACLRTILAPISSNKRPAKRSAALPHGGREIYQQAQAHHSAPLLYLLVHRLSLNIILPPGLKPRLVHGIQGAYKLMVVSTCNPLLQRFFITCLLRRKATPHLCSNHGHQATPHGETWHPNLKMKPSEQSSPLT